MLCFSLPAFIGQHFSATLAARQALSEQAGGSLCWQLSVSFLVSPGTLALSPLSVYSLRSPDTSRAVETPARVQQSQTCHYISLSRERNRADAACRELPWGWGHWCTCRVRPMLASFDPQLSSFRCHQQWRSLCQPLTMPARTGQAGGMKLRNKLPSSSLLENCRATVGANLP